MSSTANQSPGDTLEDDHADVDTGLPPLVYMVKETTTFLTHETFGAPKISNPPDKKFNGKDMRSDRRNNLSYTYCIIIDGQYFSNESYGNEIVFT